MTSFLGWKMSPILKKKQQQMDKEKLFTTGDSRGVGRSVEKADQIGGENDLHSTQNT